MKLLLIILLIIVSCTGQKDNESKSLNIALTSPVPTLDPAISYDTVSSKVVYQMHEALYQYDYLTRPYKLKPLLAESMPSISSDGLTYTVKIKKNIYYHKSSLLNEKRIVVAQDFINQFKRVAYKPTKSNGWWLFDGKIKGLNEFRNKSKNDFSDFFSYEVEGLKAVNEHTLQIKLTKPFPQLIYALAMAFTTPAPKEVILASNNDFSAGSIGTGPYYLNKWNRGLSIELSSFSNYHNEKYPSTGDHYSRSLNLLKDSGKSLPFIKNIKFHIMKEAQTRWLNFLNEKIDLIVLSKEHFPLALDSSGKIKSELEKKGITLQIAPTLTYWWLSFNMKDKVVGRNLNLRKAIAHAVDIDTYIETFTNNLALKANSIYPPGIPGYNPSNQLPYSYDLDLAKKFLVKAGYKDGKGLPIINYDVRGNSTVSRQMGEFIKKELAKIGIKIKVIINSFPNFLNKARTGQLQFWQGGWAMDYPDAENSIQLLYSKNHSPGPNSSFYKNKLVDQSYLKIASSSNQDEIRKNMKVVQETVNSELPWIMQYYSRNYILFHNKLKNFRQSDLIINTFKYLDIER